MLYKIKIKPGHSYGGVSEGGIVEVTEPIANTLIAAGVAKMVDKLPKLSSPGTKAVRASAVTTKG